jgi:hypothetical protein
MDHRAGGALRAALVGAFAWANGIAEGVSSPRLGVASGAGVGRVGLFMWGMNKPTATRDRRAHRVSAT